MMGGQVGVQCLSFLENSHSKTHTGGMWMENFNGNVSDGNSIWAIKVVHYERDGMF